ncbi:MAG: hypothetical protein AAFR98_05445 [Pseudomonadota bacterium]
MALIERQTQVALNIGGTAKTTLASLLALRAGYRHRRELSELTPEQRADFGMTSEEQAAALLKPVTQLPDYKVAKTYWERRLDFMG